MRKHLRVVPCDMPMPLVDCPPGLFLFGIEKEEPTVGIKTEYWTHDPQNLEVYCVESGEYFWGGVDSKVVRGALLVVPARLEWEN